jgi:hypothetical protein
MPINRAAWLLFVVAALAWAPALTAQPATRILVQSSPVAGFQFHEGKRVWDQLKVGDALALVREPDNPFDAAAIRLEWNGRKIGYVPRQENGALARELDAGKTVEARIIELSKRRNGRHLIGYDILVPLQAAPEALKESK